jgi:Carboxypeptidase regulatory-like domain
MTELKTHRRGESLRRNLIGYVMALVVLMLPASLLAQIGKSGITGIITDPSGAVVPAATVTVENEASGVKWSTISTAAGLYIIRGLPPGSYTVTVDAHGFKEAVIAHVVTEVEQVKSASVKLSLGSQTQKVQVTASPNQLNTNSGTIGTLVNQKQIETLPLNGRSWISLNYLAPGVTPFIGLSMNFSNMTESVAPGNVVANGLRGGNNLYFIDGVSTADVEDFIISVYPPLDAIAEFRTQTGNASSEYFGGAGAMVSAVIKSGTNRFHGDVWEFLRNNVLDARDFFNATVPPLKRNQFGFTFGGPIRKDRTFFFGSYEGFRQRLGIPFVGDYPTPAMRNGDLSSIPTQLTNPYTGQPIPGNDVSSMINPLSTKWLNDWIPLPNTNVPIGSGNYRQLAVRPIDYDSYLLRVDELINDKNRLFGHFLYSNARSNQPVILPGLTRYQRRPGYNAVADYTRTINPTTVIEGRFGFQLYDDHEPVGTVRNANMLDELGVSGATGFSTVADSQLAPPPVGVAGFSPFGGSYFGRPRRIYNYSYYYDGTVFATRGQHAMSMGVNVAHNIDHFPETILPTGNWSYNGFFTGNGFADFLLGIPRSVSALPYEFEPNARRWTEGVWFQDDWKARSNLTLSLGLRWDRDGGYVSASNTVANFDLSSPPVAVNMTGNNPLPGWGKALFDAPWNKLFAPRLGFAYRATPNTVVRGAYGIYWQPMTADPIVNISINSPFEASLGATVDFSNLSTFDRANPLAASTAVGFGATAITKNFQPGYVQQWNLMIERNVRGTLFSAAYVGNKGTHLVNYYGYNAAPLGQGPINPRRPFTQLLIRDGAGGIIPPGTLPAGGISLQDSGGDSIYHGLQLEAKRRFKGGLAFTASYSFSKSIDDVSESYIEGRGLGVQQPMNHKAERARSDFNVANALTFSYIYALPFGSGRRFASQVRGAAAGIIGGWQLDGITTIFSGMPVGPIFNSIDNLNNGVSSGYPNEICDPNLGGGRGSGAEVSRFFNTSCFAAPPPYTFGNANRGSVIGPGTQLWNIALQKNTNITERVSAEFRAEFFNAFNHPNFSFPNTSFGTPQFGQISSSSQAPRQIQFGLKLIF